MKKAGVRDSETPGGYINFDRYDMDIDIRQILIT